MDNKIALRNNAKELRKTMDIEKISISAVELVKECEIYKNSKNVMIYYPTKYETDFTKLLDDNKDFYLPRVCEDNLEVCPYTGKNNLKKSKLNIFEPITSAVDKSVLDLVIVPALMVDKNGYRLGYGGGYYDRFLKDFKGKSVCVIPHDFYTDELPHENYDISVDVVIVC